VAVRILSEYLSRALAHAVYERLEDGTYGGRIPDCVGVVSFGQTQRESEEELRSVLEDWLLMGLKKGHELPVIEGIDLNREDTREPLEAM